MSYPEIVTLVVVATLGHVMAGFWYIAHTRNWKICERVIYDMPIEAKQLAREIKNSIHTPIHAIILAVLVLSGAFRKSTWLSFLGTAVLTTLWAEIWHYASHRAFPYQAAALDPCRASPQPP